MHSPVQPTLYEPRSRCLTQDVMRGLMLLFIIISNAQFFLWTAQHGPTGWHPIDGHTVDRVVRFLMIVLLDLRVYPLFAFLFGYGMMQLYLRRTAAGLPERDAIWVLRRRSLLLIAFGSVHAALLLAGDILGAYGLMSLVVGWLFLRRTDRTLLIAAGVAIVLVVFIVLFGWAQVISGIKVEPGPPSTAAYAAGAADWLSSIPTRMGTWLAVTIGSGLLGFASYASMLLGVWAARRHLIESPQHHLKLLRGMAMFGIPVGILGGCFAALAHTGGIDVPSVALMPWGAMFNLQVLTGVPAALGYAAVLILIMMKLSPRMRATTSILAVAASGKRALTSYFAHSLLMVPMLAAWGFGLGAHLNSATVTAFAFLVWTVVVLACHAAERGGLHGPAEVLLRRLAYGQRLGALG